MELMITRWNMPNRQVKILEFFTSIQEIYEGDDILSLSLLEERNSGNGSIPIGNISSNEITLTLNNKTRKFDAGNTKSSLYKMLKPNRRIKAWLGIKKDNGEKELVPLGTFWSGDWDVPEDNLYVKTVGTDKFKFLNESDYNNTTLRVDLSLYDLASEILEDAGLSKEEYWVDEELEDYVIPFVKLDSQSHIEALRKVTNACLGQTYYDRYGVIRIEGQKPISSIYEVSVNERANIFYPSQVTDDIESPDALFASLDGT